MNTAMRKNAPIVTLAAAILFVGARCDTAVTPTKPVVSAAALDTDCGGTLQLSWTAVTHAESYEVKTDDTTYTTTSLGFDVTKPTSTIEVKAVNGSHRSDPATIDCRVVETESLGLCGISAPGYPSGLAFDDSGSASALSLDTANRASVDFVCDDVNITPVGLVNAGDYQWPQNSKVNRLMDAGTTDYDAFVLAPDSGDGTQLEIHANDVYALWLSASTTWTAGDHFCKAKVVSIEDVGGTQKATLKVAYQKIGGLRWLVK
jgi:hypothetical protein